MADLAFPGHSASFFGNLPATPTGMFYPYSWMQHQLIKPGVTESSEAVVAMIRDTTIVLGMLLHETLCLEQLTFRLGVVELGRRRSILMWAHNHYHTNHSAELSVLLDPESGELGRPYSLQLTTFCK